MAAKSFLRLVSGRIQQVFGVQASAGAGNAGDIPALDDTGRIDSSMMPVGVVPDTSSIVASEALDAGDFVNIWDDAGTPKIRKADATTSGKEADGFVLAAVSLGASGSVHHEGTNTQLAGLTPGARYYLHTTAGLVTAAPPSGSGNVVQYLGRAVSATAISFEPDAGIVLA